MRKFILILLLPLQVSAQYNDLEKFIDSLFAPGNRSDVPGTMILIAEYGKPVIQKAYGMASLELPVPLTTNHVIAIGSVSKQFTSVAMLQLVEQGKVKLTDDIRKYFPAYNSQGQVITIENLLTHTSGISSTERPDIPQFRKDNGVSFHHNEFLAFAGNSKLLFPPGTSWSYNNIAFMLAALVVEKVSGEPFADYLRDHVFLPAGMTKTYLASDLIPRTNVAMSYVRTNIGWRNDDRENNWGWEKGAGGIMSTLDDMLKWDIALRENKVLSAASTKKAWEPYVLRSGVSTNYGLGWYISRFPSYNIISHSGTVNGFRSNSIHIPEKGLYIFYVGMNGIDQHIVPKKILSRLLNMSLPAAVKKAAAPLSDYTGTYQIHYFGTRSVLQATSAAVHAYVTSSGDSLFFRQQMGEKTILRPAAKDTFLWGRNEGGYFVFHRNSAGQVSGYTFATYLFGGGATGVMNKKVTLPPPPPVRSVTLTPEKLASYSGTYYNSMNDAYLFIEVENDKIYFRRINSPRLELLAVAGNKFIRKDVPEFSITFTQNKNGTPVAAVRDFRSLEYRKLGF